MYAVIKSGGKQHKVKQGQVISVEKLEKDIDSNIEFEEVLMIADGGDVAIGSPYVDGGKVVAKVVEHGRHRKIEIIKFKRRKHHMKRMGHRQYFTKIEIVDIKKA